jgi:hypothetical protein
VAVSASHARYWRTFEAYVRRVCSDSGADPSAAVYSSRTAANGCDRPTAARPRRRAGAVLVFSEAVSARCGGRGFVFSEAIRGVYFRERVFSEVPGVAGRGVRRAG